MIMDVMNGGAGCVITNGQHVLVSTDRKADYFFAMVDDQRAWVAPLHFCGSHHAIWSTSN